MSPPSSIASSSGGKQPSEPHQAESRSPGGGSSNLAPPSNSEPPRFQNKGRHGRTTRPQAEARVVSPGSVSTAGPPAAERHNHDNDQGNHIHDTLRTLAQSSMATNHHSNGSSTDGVVKSPVQSGRSAYRQDSLGPSLHAKFNANAATTWAYTHKYKGHRTRNRYHNPSYTPQNRGYKFKTYGGIKKSYAAQPQTTHCVVRSGLPISSPQQSYAYSTWDISPPSKPSNYLHDDNVLPFWDHYTNLSIDDLDRAKNLVLDLLGWGVETQYLLNCGVSSRLIHRVFTDLNLRLPHDFVSPNYPT